MKHYKEKGVDSGYIKLVEQLSHEAERRRMGLPINSKTPVPFRPQPVSLLQRMLDTLI